MFLLRIYSSSTLLKEKQNFARWCGWVYSKSSFSSFLSKIYVVVWHKMKHFQFLQKQKYCLWNCIHSYDDKVDLLLKISWIILISVIWFWFKRSFWLDSGHLCIRTNILWLFDGSPILQKYKHPSSHLISFSWFITPWTIWRCFYSSVVLTYSASSSRYDLPAVHIWDGCAC